MREYTFHKKLNLYDTTEHIIKNVLKHWEPKQIYKTLAGVPGVARDDEWRNRIANFVYHIRRKQDGMNCGNVLE
jgi:hypothetical protein